jgi:hypothetical protein
MSETRNSSVRYLIVGLILFPIGLLMLLGQPTVIDLFMNLMPSIQTIEIFGTILLFLGEALVAFGIIGSITNRIILKLERDRITLTTVVNRSGEQQAVVAMGLRTVESQIAHISTKLQQTQSIGNTIVSTKVPSNCKYCGARMGEGNFCPNFGRAQT